MKTLIIISIMTMLGHGLTSQMQPTLVESSPVVGLEKKEVQLKDTPLAASKAVSETFKPGVVKAQAVPQSPSGGCEDWMRQAGVTDMVNASILIQKESGCRVDADNPSSDAYGIPQALPGSKMAGEGADWATNPVTQIRWMQKYCIERYGSWAGAVAFHNANNYY